MFLKTKFGKGCFMRKWGVIVTLFYTLIVLGLLLPVAALLVIDNRPFLTEFYKAAAWFYGYLGSWILFAIVLSGEAILLFLSVDTSFKHLKPRAHIVISHIVASMLFALLTFAVIASLDATVKGTSIFDRHMSSATQLIGFCGGLWLLWGILFYLYFRDSIDVTTRLVSWLLKGSVLELLIAVPCHVIVRRRHDCSAPIVTSFGIVTGIAVMLLCFGPSVLLLYKKRMDSYSAQNTE
jgi:hypothetical protein